MIGWNVQFARILLAAVVTWVALASAAAQAGGPRKGDSWWLIDTRHLSDCPGGSPPTLRMQRCTAGTWQTATLDEFLAEGDGQITVFHMHGNRIPACEVVARGQIAYQSLVGETTAPPVRFVFWSWPSDKVKGQLKDVRYKAERADADAWYLAWLLNRLPASHRISLLGYSFGARIATGALHLRAGGALEGIALAPAAAERSPVRVTLLAAALHCDWLSPGGSHEMASNQIDQLVLAINSCDPALQRYRFLDRCEKPEALGYVGLPGHSDLSARTTQLNACCTNGRSHEECLYYQAGDVVASLRQNLLWQGESLPAASAAARQVTARTQ